MTSRPIPDPTIQSYFLGRGFRHITKAFFASCSDNMLSAENFFNRSPQGNQAIDWMLWAFWSGAGLSAIITGFLLTSAATVLHLLLLIVLTVLNLLLLTVVVVLESVYLGWRNFFVACPHCYARSSIPEYICDKCGLVHKKLVPNIYGILAHECRCGNSLPATFFCNRGRLEAQCGSCHQRLSRAHIESRKIFIPILGGPSVGKSAFLYGLASQLLEPAAARALGYEVDFLDQRTRKSYSKAIEAAKAGQPPTKTQDELPRALNLELRKNGRLKFILYFYDPAGEVYQEIDKLVAHRFYRYLSGLILIIDPFSLPEVKMQYSSLLKKHGHSIRPSNFPVDDLIDRLIVVLEQEMNLRRNSSIDKPIAIVLNKIDAFDLDKIIGSDALKRCMEKPRGSTAPADHDLSKSNMLREQLEKWGQKVLVRRLHSRFSKIRYFSCSALQHLKSAEVTDRSPHSLFRCLIWIINQQK